MTKGKIGHISAQDLKQIYDNDPQLCLIDVRELEEWQAMHIPHALHIPLAELASRIKEISPGQDQPVYIHCQGGVRSCTAAAALLELGYSHVYSLNGGIRDWEKSGHPVKISQ